MTEQEEPLETDQPAGLGFRVEISSATIDGVDLWASSQHQKVGEPGEEEHVPPHEEHSLTWKCGYLSEKSIKFDERGKEWEGTLEGGLVEAVNEILNVSTRVGLMVRVVGNVEEKAAADKGKPPAKGKGGKPAAPEATKAEGEWAEKGSFDVCWGREMVMQSSIETTFSLSFKYESTLSHIPPEGGHEEQVGGEGTEPKTSKRVHEVSVKFHITLLDGYLLSKEEIATGCFLTFRSDGIFSLPPALTPAGFPDEAPEEKGKEIFDYILMVSVPVSMEKEKSYAWRFGRWMKSLEPKGGESEDDDEKEEKERGTGESAMISFKPSGNCVAPDDGSLVVFLPKDVRNAWAARIEHSANGKSVKKSGGAAVGSFPVFSFFRKVRRPPHPETWVDGNRQVFMAEGVLDGARDLIRPGKKTVSQAIRLHRVKHDVSLFLCSDEERVNLHDEAESKDVKKGGKGGKDAKGAAPSTASDAPKILHVDDSLILSEESTPQEVSEKDPFAMNETYCDVKMEMSRSFLPSVDERPRPSISPTDLVMMKEEGEKEEKKKATPAGLDAFDDFGEEINILARDVMLSYGSILKDASVPLEERRRLLMFELNNHGKFFEMKERLKRAVVRIVREKMDVSVLEKDKEAFLNTLYIDLVKRMRMKLSEEIFGSLSKTREDQQSQPRPESSSSSGEVEADDLLPAQQQALRNDKKEKELLKRAEQHAFHDNLSAADKAYVDRIALQNFSDRRKLPLLWVDYAAFQLHSHQKAKAEACLREALTLDMTCAPAMLMYGMFLMNEERHAEAEVMLQALADLEPERECVWELLWLLYDFYLEDSEKAHFCEKQWESLTHVPFLLHDVKSEGKEQGAPFGGKRSGKMAVRAEVVGLLLSHRLLGIAERYLEEMSGEDEEEDDEEEEEADEVEEEEEEARRRRQEQETMTLWDKMREKDSRVLKQSDRLLAQAQLFFYREEYERAKEIASSVISSDVKNIDAWELMGDLYHKHKHDQLTECIEAYEAVLSILHQIEQQDAEEGAEMKKKYIGVFYRLGECYFLNSDYEHAKDDLLVFCKHFPTAIGFRLLAMTLVNLGELDTAILVYEESNRLDPEDAETWLRMSETFLSMKSYSSARLCLMNARRCGFGRLGVESVPSNWTGELEDVFGVLERFIAAGRLEEGKEILQWVEDDGLFESEQKNVDQTLLGVIRAWWMTIRAEVAFREQDTEQCSEWAAQALTLFEDVGVMQAESRSSKIREKANGLLRACNA
eukprot:TRINITY_DN464_c0_g2_i1.p1 TRINITY_DN464_c0_g2~~TRINITY_DN464_c0_g2_i1.p1  ORF type:complete len:1249 (+),score=475.56 TRINITY_DN464_c0_g2_i1:140-3886(+)